MRKKSVITILTLLLTTSMTACSFQFQNIGKQVQTQTEIITQEMGSKLSSIVDETDFKSEDLSQLVDSINEWAEGFSQKSDYVGEFQRAKLVRVVDGDTIVVDIEGDQYKVRLIGVDTPESVASEEYLEKTGKENTQEGTDASEFTKAALENCEVVYLQKDVSDTDRYNRLLRYVWLELPDDKEDVEEISTKMLNGILLSEGVANAVVYEPDTYYAEVFAEIEFD